VIIQPQLLPTLLDTPIAIVSTSCCT